MSEVVEKNPGEKRPSAPLFVLFGAACYATSGPLARWGRPTHPLIIAFGRLLLAALILGTIERRPIAEGFARLSWKQRGIVLFAGACLGVHFALFQLGLENTSLPAAVSLISLEPLSVVLAAWLFLSIRPSRREQAGVLFASAGAVVVAQGAGQGEHKLSGDLLVLGAVVLYGLYLTVARALKDALPARAYAAMVYAGAAVVTGLSLLLPQAREGLAAPPPHGLVAIAAITLVPTLLGHTAVQTASRTLPPSIVALVSPGETVGAIAIGAALLHALPTTAEITGTLIILLGSALAITAPAPRPPSTVEKRDP
ncbi:MAG: DMT family transporter [Byssovorax sp.]